MKRHGQNPLGVIRPRQGIIVAIAVLIVLAVGYWCGFLLASQYQASTSLRVDDTLAAQWNIAPRETAGRQMNTYAEILRSQSVLSRVISKLKLPFEPSSLAEHLNVTIPEETQILRLTITDSDPTRACAIANTLADEFIGFYESTSKQASSSVAAVLQENLTKLQTTLEQAMIQLARLNREPAGVERDTQTTRLQNEIQAYRNMLTTYIAKEMQDSLLGQNLYVVDRAIENPHPIRSLSTLNPLIGLLFGFAMGVGCTYLVHRYRTNNQPALGV